ncbi:hypothetical protein D3C72_1444570 [compost metagenome]
MQLGNVHEPVLGIRPLDLGIQFYVARLERGGFEYAGQGHAQLMQGALHRQVGCSLAARHRQAVDLQEVAGHRGNAELRRAAVHRRTLRGGRPSHAAHRDVACQLRELAAFELPPGPAGDAPGNRGHLDPWQPRQRLQVIDLRIDLPAPVRGVLRIRGEKTAVELSAQFYLVGKRRAGRSPQHEPVGQAAIARQEIDVVQLQLGRLAQFVLPAQGRVAHLQFALRRQPAQPRMIQVGFVIAGVQVYFLSGNP